jgi:hypothetical protein
MKLFSFAATATVTAALGLVAITAPASAATFAWDIKYSGWWTQDGGGEVSGTIIADEASAADGIISYDEIFSWVWNWTGNTAVAAFSIESGNSSDALGFPGSFYVNGTPNRPIGENFVDDDNLDQGIFASKSENEVIDFQALLVQNVESGGVSLGNVKAAAGRATVSAPRAVPEPATLAGLIAVGAMAAPAFARKREQA